MARIVFITGHRFGISLLRGLLDAAAGIEVVAVLGLHPRHAPDTVGYADAASIAAGMGLPATTFNSAKAPAIAGFLRERPHDYLFTVGLSQLVPAAVLDLPAAFNGSSRRNAPTHGCIGAHPTLLPQGRGRAPIPWTIIHGLSRSGVSVFHLEEEADAGEIVDQEPMAIDADETSATLFAKAEAAHHRLGLRLGVRCAQRDLVTLPRSHQDVSVWGKRTAKDGWLDLAQPARDLLRVVRALQPPYPPAFLVHRSAVLPVVEAIVHPPHGGAAAPGLVLHAQDHTVIAAAADALITFHVAPTAAAPLPPAGAQLLTSRTECLDA